MDSNQLGQGNSAETKGVIVPEIRLSGKGALGKVFQGLDVLGCYTLFIEFILIKGDFFIDPFHLLLEMLQLELPHLL